MPDRLAQLFSPMAPIAQSSNRLTHPSPHQSDQAAVGTETQPPPASPTADPNSNSPSLQINSARMPKIPDVGHYDPDRDVFIVRDLSELSLPPAPRGTYRAGTYLELPALQWHVSSFNRGDANAGGLIALLQAAGYAEAAGGSVVLTQKARNGAVIVDKRSEDSIDHERTHQKFYTDPQYRETIMARYGMEDRVAGAIFFDALLGESKFARELTNKVPVNGTQLATEIDATVVDTRKVLPSFELPMSTLTAESPLSDRLLHIKSVLEGLLDGALSRNAKDGSLGQFRSYEVRANPNTGHIALELGWGPQATDSDPRPRTFVRSYAIRQSEPGQLAIELVASYPISKEVPK